MDLINQFIENYKKKFNYYETAGRLAAGQLETALQASGIRAIVTSRAKAPGRLKSKVLRRNDKREPPYKNMNDIYNDIADLSGVRVSLYFPGDREKADKIINNLLTVYETKKFPGQSKQPSYNKRFSGYWANHYRASMKEDKLSPSQKKYSAVRIEIQVASVLMHAWSEVEHDLVYKPLQGTLSEEELSIIDELNGLVLTGEIALERLQEAGNERIRSKNTTFNSQYDLASYLYNYISSKYKRNDIESRMGNVELLFKLTGRLKIANVKEIDSVLRSLKIVSDKRTISEQIIDQIISGNEKRYRLYKELRADNEQTGLENAKAAETFLDQWIRLESLLNKLTYKVNPKARGTFNLNTLKRLELCSKESLDAVAALRNFRNHLVHGIEVSDTDYVKSQTEEVQRILSELSSISNKPEERIQIKNN